MDVHGLHHGYQEMILIAKNTEYNQRDVLREIITIPQNVVDASILYCRASIYIPPLPYYEWRWVLRLVLENVI